MKDKNINQIINMLKRIKKTFVLFCRLFSYRFSYLKYLNAKFICALRGMEYAKDEYDLVFVVFDSGWILDGICKEIAGNYHGRHHFCYDFRNLPPAKAYYFFHYSTIGPALKYNPFIWGKVKLAWYTHPSNYYGIYDEEFVYLFDKINKVVCSCSMFVKLLSSQGVSPEKLTYVLGAADPKIFEFHKRSGGSVGFSARYYLRKNPDCILNIVKNMPHRNFIMLGKGWELYPRFAELKSLPNFQYVDAPYAQYPEYYKKVDVFVSVSILEGGPIPLIEAMMSNAVPVVSNTGFAPDIIRHKENGFIFDVNAPVRDVCALIDKAFALETNVRKTVEHLTWERFSSEILKCIV